jgi:hypothetical protein
MAEQQAPGLARIAAKYGLIQGVLSFIVFLAGALTGTTGTWTPSLVTAALLIVLMILAHREIKKTHAGKMTYAQGLGSGTLLAGVATVLSCVFTYVYVKYINTGYIAAVMQAQRAALAQRGMSGAQAEQAMAITSAIVTPVGIAVTGLITGVIVGFILALIVSIFTQVDDPKAVT